MIELEKYEVHIRQNPETGIVELESWYLDGKHHRVGAPALIHRDPQTGVAIAEDWMRSGFSHREDGPAVIHRHRKTGQTISERFFVYGHEVPRLGSAAPAPDDPSP